MKIEIKLTPEQLKEIDDLIGSPGFCLCGQSMNYEVDGKAIIAQPISSFHKRREPGTMDVRVMCWNCFNIIYDALKNLKKRK